MQVLLGTSAPLALLPLAPVAGDGPLHIDTFHLLLAMTPDPHRHARTLVVMPRDPVFLKVEVRLVQAGGTRVYRDSSFLGRK